MQERQIKLYKHFEEQHFNMLSIASEGYNRIILSLSTAVLGFTFAIIKLVINKINCPCLLILAWVFLILTIAAILVSYIATQLHASHRIKYMNSLIDGRNDVSKDHPSDNVMFYSQLI